MRSVFKSDMVKDVIVSYVCMIVIPVLLVLVIAFVISGHYIYRAASDSVKAAQNTILEFYGEEKNNTALALSRVVNMENGTLIKEAAGIDKKQQKVALEQLNTLYQVLAAPDYSILDIHIYRKSGLPVTQRGTTRYSADELRTKEWYQKALRSPGEVCISMEDEDYFYRIRSYKEMLIVAAFAPEDTPEAECVVLYKTSKIPDMIKKYNSSGRLGNTFIVNETGKLIAQSKEDIFIPDVILEKIGNRNTDQLVSFQGLKYIITPIPESKYFLITSVNEWSMFGKFLIFFVISLAVIFCIILMFIFYFKWYMSRMLVPLQCLTEGMKRVENHNLNVQVPVCRQQDIAQMIITFNNMVKQIQELIHDKEEAERGKYQEELHNLQAQMNPHFLMNTLNTLKLMAVSARFDGMTQMVTALENILDAVLDRDGGLYTAGEEQSVLESYIYIMQFRYIDSFEVKLEISPEIKACKIPKLVLQPIVENCIIHGFDGQGEHLDKIKITGCIRDGKLVFEVIDNGKGMDQEEIDRIMKLGSEIQPDCDERGEDESGEEIKSYRKRRTIGLGNTDRRLKLNFGFQYGIKIESKLGAFTKITLIMPVVLD